MATADRRAHDQEMAHRMKQSGEERESGRCCLCFQIIPTGGPNGTNMDRHFLQCSNRTPAGSTKYHRYQSNRVQSRR